MCSEYFYSTTRKKYSTILHTKTSNKIYLCTASQHKAYLICFLFPTQVLNLVNVITVARFLPVILNQLFHILVVTENEDVSLNVVRYVTKSLAGAYSVLVVSSISGDGRFKRG